MNLTQMRYFSEVCKWQSISKAAQSLHVSQPTISIAMKELEHETGLNLFRHVGKCISLTDDAQVVCRKIIPILAQLDRLDVDIDDLAQRKNHIRLAVPLQVGVRLIPALFSEFRSSYPEIDLEIIEAGGIDSLRMLENEEIDLAVTNYDENYMPNLKYNKIYENEFHFITYPGHPLAERKKISYQDLSGIPLCLLNGGFFISRRISENCQQANVHLNVLFYSSQLSTIINLVHQRLMLTILMGQVLLPHEGLIAIPFSPKSLISCGIITKPGRQIYSDEHKLINFVKKRYAKLVSQNE